MKNISIIKSPKFTGGIDHLYYKSRATHKSNCFFSDSRKLYYILYVSSKGGILVYPPAKESRRMEKERVQRGEFLRPLILAFFASSARLGTWMGGRKTAMERAFEQERPRGVWLKNSLRWPHPTILCAEFERALSCR